jgi:hypothetical protein
MILATSTFSSWSLMPGWIVTRSTLPPTARSGGWADRSTRRWSPPPGGRGAVPAATSSSTRSLLDRWCRYSYPDLITMMGPVKTTQNRPFVLAYDAARFMGDALLAQQGLRPTQAGGHLAVTDAVRAQFAGPFTALGTLRRRRNELEYPSYSGEHIESQEVTAAIDIARELLSAAHRLLGHLGLFRYDI